MSATVVVDEYNTVSETKTANITNTNMGSDDSANLNTTTYPIAPGANSYEKWQKVAVTNLGGSSAIDNLQIWETGALSGSDALVTNARTSSYGGAESFATPTTNASSVATEAMPTSDPGGANLGIGGALDGALTDVGSSDYLVFQLQVDSETTAGTTVTMNYQYDETA